MVAVFARKRGVRWKSDDGEPFGDLDHSFSGGLNRDGTTTITSGSPTNVLNGVFQGQPDVPIDASDTIGSLVILP